MEKYYLLSSKYKHNDAGTIFKYDGKKIYDILKNTDFKFSERIPSYWIEISGNEASYLVTKDIGKRIDLHKRGIYGHIERLTYNDRCYFIRDKQKYMCSIIEKLSKQGMPHYVLKTESGTKYTVSLIHLELLNESTLDESQTIAEECTDSNNAPSSVQSNSSSPEVSQIIQWRETGLEIINPNAVKVVDKDQKLVTKKRVLMIQGTKISVVVKWRGMLDHCLCIGCELDMDFDDGCDGRINGQTLFQCRDKRGVFIFLKDSEVTVNKTCERVRKPCHNHINKSENNLIEKDCICCLEEDSFDDNTFKERVVVLPDGSRRTCKWRGKVNGVDCVGVEINDKLSGARKDLNTKARERSFNSMWDFFDVTDIIGVVAPDIANMEVVNVANIRSVDGEQVEDKWLSLKQGNAKSIVLLKWKGRVDGRMSLGCVLDKDIEYLTDVVFRGHQLFECPSKIGVLLVLDDNVECCERGGTGHKEIKVGWGMIIDGSCLCCAERRDKLTLSSHIKTGNAIILGEHIRGTIKWTGLINADECIGVEMDNHDDGTDGTFNGMGLFRCRDKRGVLVKVADIPTTILSPMIDIHIMNPTNLESIVSHRNLSLHIVKRINDKAVVIEVKWLGKINGEKCVGAVLPNYYMHGTDGRFMGGKLFECLGGRGVLVPVEDIGERCVSDSAHALFEDVDICPINEDDICCIREYGKPVKFKSGQTIILRINNKKHFATFYWMGYLNGQETLAVDIDYFRKDARAGTFCGLYFFGNSTVTGVLLPTQNMAPEEHLQFIRDIYLRNDYFLDKVQKDRHVDAVSKLFVINDSQKIYGRAQFLANLCGEWLLALNLEPHYNVPHLEGAVYRDNASNQDYVIVKLDCAEEFKGGLEYIQGSGVVDMSSVKVKENYSSELFKIDITVKYSLESKECVGNIQGFQLLNGIPCVAVCDIGNNLNPVYVLEGSLSKLSSDDVARSSVICLSSTPRSNANSIHNNQTNVVRSPHKSESDENSDDQYKSARQSFNSDFTTCPNEVDSNNASDSQNSQNDSEFSFLNDHKEMMNLSHDWNSADLTNRYDTTGDSELVHEQCLHTLTSDNKTSSEFSGLSDHTNMMNISPDDNSADLSNRSLTTGDSELVHEQCLYTTTFHKKKSSELDDLSDHANMMDISPGDNSADLSNMSLTTGDSELVHEQCLYTTTFRKKKRSITCTENNVSVFDPKYITEVETIDNVDKVIIFTCKGKRVVAKLKIIGQVGDDACIGCELGKKSQYGTDGRFGNSKLFHCTYGKGVLIPLADITDCCVNGKHEELQLLLSGRIMESSVCCIDVLGQLRGKPKIHLGEKVMRMTDKGNIFGACRWKGLVNSKEVIGVEMERFGGDPCDGDALMANLSLFDCIPNNTELFLSEGFTHGSELSFLHGIFLTDKVDLSRYERSSDLANRHVIVKHNELIYGECLYALSLCGHSLMAIDVDICCFHKNNELFSKISHYNNGNGARIVVRRECVDVFEPLRYINGSIDLDSITSYYVVESAYYKKGDVVTYDFEGEKFYGIVKRCKLLNGVRCVGLKHSICGGADDVKFFLEDLVHKLRFDQFITTYFQDTVVDPRSILSCTQAVADDIDIGDAVRFTVSGKSLQGRALGIVKVNHTLAVVIGLPQSHTDDDFLRYKINGEKLFEKLLSLTDDAVIVKLTSVRKKISITCTENNVSVFDPKYITEVITMDNTDKVIIFTSKGERVVAKLKMIGKVDGDDCIGCELIKKSPHGTDGTFNRGKLFDCAEGRGVLIALDDIKDCCVKGIHKQLQLSPRGRIMESSVCCIDVWGQLRGKAEIQLGMRVMRTTDNGNGFGTCRWKGLVNNEYVIGVEMTRCASDPCDSHGDGAALMASLPLFDYIPNNTELFLSEGFTHDSVGLRYCHTDKTVLVDVSNIHTVDGGQAIDKSIVYRVGGDVVVLSVRFRGEVNGAACVGCEVIRHCECATDGEFGAFRWFTCPPTKAVILIPVKHLKSSCEFRLSVKEPSDGHSKLIKNNIGIIDPQSICCIDSLGRINKSPLLKIGSKLKCKAEVASNKKIGNCKWMGLVNGVECVCTTLRGEANYGWGAKFPFLKLIYAKAERASIFMTEDVEHDVEGEKLPFVIDKFVDVTGVWKVKAPDSDNIHGLKIGDYVSTYVTEDVGAKLTCGGELKWMGKINNEDCVGIDLESEVPYGIDGLIRKRHSFLCRSKHGVVTTADNVDLNKEEFKVARNGFVDSHRFLRLEERRVDDQLTEKRVSMGRDVFVILELEEGPWKRRGILRWIGTMNEDLVAVVELAKCHDNGTDGLFWRQQLIKCGDGRAVAMLLENIHEYIPYVEVEIPNEKRLFPNIDINSAVVHYIPFNNSLKSLYGTVRWAGQNEFDEYLYGIELDDRFLLGTNGTFKKMRLFQCDGGYGILAGIDEVAPDVRFTQLELTDEDVPESNKSAEQQYSIPTRSWSGEQIGIQGNSNSCYFDSSIFALFSKSDVLDFMISPLINQGETNDITTAFRNIMAYNIVYPLREFGFVSFHQTQRMRDVIKGYGQRFEEMTKHETDMENVAALLAKLSPDDQLLKLTTFTDPEKINKNKTMFLQLFITLNHKEKHISSRQMLDMSMSQNEIMFDELPTCLIMQAPRDARGINCYDNVLPSRVIEISHLCLNSYKKCSKCDAHATHQCKICVEHHMNTKDGLFCNDHQCAHGDLLKVPDSSKGSKSEVQMQLKAIICIERAHFVTYVKEDEYKKKWVFFDSMSTQNVANNYSVPKVNLDRKVSEFLEQDEDHMLQQLNGNTPAELKRITKDSYIFIYHNTTKTCY